MLDAIDRLSQDAREEITAHFAVGDHIEIGCLLEGEGFIDGSIFNPFELGGRQYASLRGQPRFFQVDRTQQ